MLTIAVKKNAKLDITFLKSCPILLYFLTLCQNFAQDCLSKQIFGGNVAQSPSHLKFWIFFVTSKKKQLSKLVALKVPHLMVLC